MFNLCNIWTLTQTVTSRILSHMKGVDPESTTWTCYCPLWEAATMRTEGAKTVDLKYAAGEMYLSLSWIQRRLIYWKVGLIVVVNCSFSLFTFPSLASPSHCSFSVQGSKTLQSKSLVNSYYSGTHVCTHTHLHEHTHLWRCFRHWLIGAKSCRLFQYLKLTWTF